MKYFFIAGEASGDLHASNVIKQLKSLSPNASFIGLGGGKMREAGCQIVIDYSQMAFMGFLTVIRNWRKVIRNFIITRRTLLKEQPDVLVLVDYPSFNLQMAKFAYTKLPHTKTVYYIPPKVWAWKAFRIHQIHKYCSAVYAIFPFEVPFYHRYGYDCLYVGNPTVDSIHQWKTTTPSPQPPINTPYIALLPGSRKAEVQKCLPLMLKVAREFPQFHIIVCQAPSLTADNYTDHLLPKELLTTDTYTTLSHASLAIVNSGTATLETALLGCPQVSLYHVAFSKILGWMKPILFSIKYFTLVNIILGEEVIQEMVSYKFTYQDLYNEVSRIINDREYRERMLTHYDRIKDILGDKMACREVATRLVEPI